MFITKTDGHYSRFFTPSQVCIDLYNYKWYNYKYERVVASSSNPLDGDRRQEYNSQSLAYILRQLDLEKEVVMFEFLGWIFIALISLIVVFVAVAILDNATGITTTCFYIAGGVMCASAFIAHAATTRFTVAIAPEPLAFAIVGLLCIVAPLPWSFIAYKIDEVRRSRHMRHETKARRQWCDNNRMAFAKAHNRDCGEDEDFDMEYPLPDIR